MIADPIRVLHLLPSWEHAGSLRRIGILANHSPPETFQFQAVALSDRGIEPTTILPATVPTKVLARGTRLQATLVWKLRRILVERRVNVVHLWTRQLRVIARMAAAGLDVAITGGSSDDLPLALDPRTLDMQSFDVQSRARLLDSFELPHRARLIGFAGHLTPDKKVVELLWALDQMHCVRDDVYLLVIGDGQARALFERYAGLYQITDHVRFVGWRSDTAYLLSIVDIYCTASQERHEPMSVLEAMAIGLSVVASDTPAHRRLVVDRQTGFLTNPAQRSELARWCLRLLDDDETRTNYGQAARQIARSRFPADRLAAACHALYANSRQV